jgi:hypothetical protein
MAKLTINRGSLANDGTGDNLREGANKVNLNFDEIYTAIGDGSTVDGTIKIADDSSTVATISANGETLRVIGGTAITSTLSGNTLTIAADTASLITASGTATLTNKSIDLTDNTVTGTLAEFNTAVSDATLVSTTGSETLTNKTINAPDNTVTNISNTNLSGSAGITNANLANSSISITGDDSSAQTISLGGGILFTGGSGITTSVSGNEITFATDGSIVTETSTDTLTNKTISGSSNTLSNIGNSSLTNSSITLGDDTISLGGTQTTVTNLSLDGATGTIDLTSSGNKLRFNYAGTGSFPSESTYEGMFAYDTTGNEAYVADAGGWTKLLNENSSVSAHADVNITSIADGNVLVWSSAQGRFNAGTISGTALTIQEEGSSLATSADTMNFVGAGITASGTGATKTITLDSGVYKGSYKNTAAHINVTNSGSSAYLFNSHYTGNNPTLHLSPGKTYAFHLNVTGHPFHLQTVSGAYSSGDAYTTGLTHVANDGTVTTGSSALLKETGVLFVDTPQGYSADIYYVCQNHSAMAGTVAMGHRYGTHTGDGSTTAFTLAYENRNSQDILVIVNGIVLTPISDYTISSSTLTFTSAPAASAGIVVRYIQ